MTSHFLACILGYFSGSVPFGLVLSQLAGLGDVRNIGSGNIGATNVLRTGNKKIAALTLVCDCLKGTIPVLIAQYFWGFEASLVAGFSALFGHIFPLWLKFKGGKGVATLIGVVFGLYWPLGLIFLGVWLAVALISKISSLSALVASAANPLFALLIGQKDLAFPFVVLGAIVWYMHRANIKRLLSGTESKISLSKKA